LSYERGLGKVLRKFQKKLFHDCSTTLNCIIMSVFEIALKTSLEFVLFIPRSETKEIASTTIAKETYNEKLHGDFNGKALVLLC